MEHSNQIREFALIHLPDVYLGPEACCPVPVRLSQEAREKAADTAPLRQEEQNHRPELESASPSISEAESSDQDGSQDRSLMVRRRKAGPERKGAR